MRKALSCPPGSLFWRWLNILLFPLKMLIPQPIIKRIPGLTTNEDIRLQVVLGQVVGRVLDIGCGSNRLVRMYRQAGGEGVGVDVYRWPGADLVVANSARLPFPDQSFETVTFVASLNHIPNRREVLREAWRLLKPEGRLVVTNLTPAISRLWHAWAFWDKDQYQRGMKVGEVWGFSHEELEALLSHAGFGIVERRRFSWWFNNLYICVKKIGPPSLS